MPRREKEIKEIGMKYDFDTVINRRNTDSLKWNVKEGELPMWVADMDFATAPEVTKAIIKRAEHGVFGYTEVPAEFYDSIINRWKSAHGLKIEKEWICFCTGVVPAISSIVKRVTNHGDKVVLQTPVYDIFFHSVENAGRQVLESPLTYADGRYAIDFADLESKLSDPLATMMILCNPHNPTGNIHTREQLAAIGKLCDKYGVTLLSDEIHCDLTDVGYDYVPYASAGRECLNSITCVSASKAFNIAGLQSAAVIIPNENLRNKVVRGLNSDEVAEPNCFAAIATAAAFNHGGEWLCELREYLTRNKQIAAKFISEKLPMLKLTEQHATYLLWINCAAVTDDAEKLCDFIRKQTGLYVTAGGQYRGNGKTFVRINTACPETVLTDGLNRLYKGITLF